MLKKVKVFCFFFSKKKTFFLGFDACLSGHLPKKVLSGCRQRDEGSVMSALEKQLSTYSEYHRDSRNVATHMVGIPLIVLAVAVLASRPSIAVGEFLRFTPAMLLSAVAAGFYLRLDLRFGIVMVALLGLANWFGLIVGAQPTKPWLAVGLGLFAAGWLLQFLGHHFEGRKPAFLDDIASLLVGPLFIVAEIAFLVGLRSDVRRAVHG